MYWAVECNREMHPFFYRYPLCLWGGCLGSGRIRALNLTVPLGSGQTISGTGRFGLLTRADLHQLMQLEGFEQVLQSPLIFRPDAHSLRCSAESRRSMHLEKGRFEPSFTYTLKHMPTHAVIKRMLNTSTSTHIHYIYTSNERFDYLSNFHEFKS